MVNEPLKYSRNTLFRRELFRAWSIAEPGPNQREVGRACRQQGDGEQHVHALERGFEAGSHHGENIGRFWPGSLGQYFSPDSGLVYDSGTPANAACPAGRPSPACDTAAPPG
jgi:hypothetical protein